MRYVTAVAALGLLLAVTGTAEALTYIFDPNDLVDLYDQGPPLGTSNPDNPRSVYTGGNAPYPGYIGIGDWNTQDYGSVRDIAIRDNYLAWRDTNNGYITQFNIWLADNPRGRGWGERLVLKPYETPVSGTTAPGWSVAVIGNPWHDDLLMVEWTADETANALSIGGLDIGEFSFSATLYVDVDEDGWDDTDPLAVLGEDYTIWFGGYGVGDDSISHESGDILWQGTLDITAVPEPVTMAGLMLGIGALAGYVRKRR